MPSPGRPPRRKKQHSIEGRRVKLSDLVDANLLDVGEKLVFERKRPPETHIGQIVGKGRIKLADGQEFDTPSAAAVAITSTAIDGWNAWRVRSTGRYLYQLRHELLQSLATSAASDGGSEEKASQAPRRFSYLDNARRQADLANPIRTLVRDLIRIWGFEERDRAGILEIEADLANHGLTTVPDFRAVGLDTSIAIVRLPTQDESPREAVEATSAPRTAALETEVGAEQSVDIGLTIGNLLPDDHSLIAVAPSDSIETAITRMELDDFSQLPVLNGSRTLRGAVTWRSIARARQANRRPTLSDAIVPVQDFRYDTRLLDVLETLQREEFIFVRAHDGQISGIITAADVVRTYDETATPFFLLGEVDQELRRLIQNTMEFQRVQQLCTFGKRPESFDDMTMGHYQAVLASEDCWRQLQWRLDQSIFIHRLDEIRKIRNKVMHFNPDPMPASAVARLRNFLNLVRTYSQ